MLSTTFTGIPIACIVELQLQKTSMVTGDAFQQTSASLITTFTHTRTPTFALLFWLRFQRHCHRINTQFYMFFAILPTTSDTSTLYGIAIPFLPNRSKFYCIALPFLPDRSTLYGSLYQVIQCEQRTLCTDELRLESQQCALSRQVL